MGCLLRVWATLALLGIMGLVCVPASSAAVGETYKGWGHTVNPGTTASVSAWRWDGAAWQSSPLQDQLQVWIQPFASGWAWAWTAQSGWVAIKSAYLSPVNIPGPANTGVPSNITLKIYTGNLVINTPGTVIDGYDVRGNVIVQASNVTIRRSIIRGRVPTATFEGIVTNYGAANTNFLLEDSTIVPMYPTDAHDGFKGQNATLRRVEITGTVDGIGVHGSNVVIEQSWIHDLAFYTPYALQPDNQTHNDAVQIHGGSNITIRNNTMNGAHNAAIMVTPKTEPVVNLSITNNWFDDGGCSVNIAEVGRGPIQGMTIAYNRFGNGNRTGNCGIVSPLTTTAVTSFMGNVWDYSGLAVTVRRG